MASDGDAPVLELWGMGSSPSLLLLPGPLSHRMVPLDRILSMGQLKLFDIYIECKQMTNIKLNCDE